MSRRATVLVSVLVVAVAVGAVWFGADFLRDRRAATNTAAAQERAVGENLAAAPRAGTQPEAGAAGTALTPSELTADAAIDTTMVLAGGDVLVSYPAGFGLAVTQEQLLVSSQIPPCDQGFDYCIYLNSDEFEGTNFSSAGVRIAERGDLTNEADCMLVQPTGYTDLVPVVAGASDFATAMYQGVDQGAAGHFSQGSLGRLYYDSVCYEFETRVAQAQFGNFPRGQVEEFDAADLEATQERLMGVLDKVTLPDARSALWARKVPTEPVDAGAVAGEGVGADSQEGEAEGSGAEAGPGAGPSAAAAEQQPVLEVAEPAAGASVASPLRLVGKVPGSWFFEATFPYQLLAADGTILASGMVTAGSDWMTEAPVPFMASIEFDVTAATDAVLVLSRDNPSGLPENDASYEIPLHLLP